MKKLSVVLATRNEGQNLADCLNSVKHIADEIIVVDEYSTDNTREIAKSYGAKVWLEPHHKIFHITKQKALAKASGKWLLQLDADERLTPALAEEIEEIINLPDEKIEKKLESELKSKKYKLFLRHQALIEKRDGKIGKDEGNYAGFFIPRRNYFLGRYLKYGGTYPDGVIRLVRNGKAGFPQKSVHEQIKIDGRVGWLKNDLLHNDSPTFKRYLEKNSRYIDLIKEEMVKDGLKKNFFNSLNYLIIKPINWFFLTTIRYKGILDGWRGIVFSFFSALRFPRAYIRYYRFSGH